MRRSRPPLVRMQHIDRELRNNHYPNCSSIARHLEVSSKSIQRDIEFMRDMLNAPIEYDPRRKGYCYRKPWHFNPADFLDRRELDALAVTSSVLAQYQGAPYYDEISRAIDKLMHALPVPVDGGGLLDIYSFNNPVPACRINEDDFAVLELAVRERKKVEITYSSSQNQEVTERTVHPYRLHYDQSGGTWYLIAYCELRQAVRTFALCRIQQMALTGEAFVISASFSIERYFEKTFNQTTGAGSSDIVIRFTPYQAQWIREHRWHPSQSIEEHRDGSLTLTFCVGALDAVKRWVMRYGSQAEVLAPLELRQMVGLEVQKMGEIYGESHHREVT